MGARRKIRENLELGGEGIATAGLVIGIIDTALWGIAIIAGIVIISIGGVVGREQDVAYYAERESIQTAVLSYYATNNSNWPTSGATNPPTIIPGYPGVIDMTLLTYATGGELPYLDITPASAHIGNHRHDWVTTGHYLWSVSSYGNVFSECEGTDCTTEADMDGIKDLGEDGWQGVYP